MSIQFEQKQIDYVRGKIAGNVVPDREGNVIVDKGQTITDDLIDKARQKGQLHYLMIAAVSSAMPPGSDELKLRLQEFRDVTEGHEAQFVRGKQAGRDVSDLQGNVIIREGETITDDHIAKATDKGVLGDVVIAVGALGLSGGAESGCACAAEHQTAGD